MNRIIVLSLVCLATSFSLWAHNDRAATSGVGLEYIPNKGQWPQGFLYKCKNAKGDVFLEKDGITYVVADAGNQTNIDAYRHGQSTTPPILKYHAYRMHLEGALEAKVSGGKENEQYYNFYLGSDQSRWQTGIHSVATVVYNDIYRGIDFVVGSEKENLKYDFVVKPGADYKQIVLRFDGINQPQLKDGNLLLPTSLGTVTELKPYAFQYIENRLVKVPCKYVLKGNSVSYFLPKGYDANYELVIDPTVVFSTFSGSTADNWGTSATYDAQGNFYAGGTVNASSGSYPTTLGAYQTTWGGGGVGGNPGYTSDMAISKFNATGTALIYSTYLGGSENEEPHSLIVDNGGNLIVAGRTYSSNYPVSANAFDNSINGGADLVITKFNTTGTALLGSTFVGGAGNDAVNISATWGTTLTSLKHNYGDNARSEVQVDNGGNIYVALPTQSNNFPVTSNAFQATTQGAQDGALVKMNPTLTSMVYGTYIGGSGDDAAYVLAFDNAQTSIFVSGGTASSNFPMPSGGYLSTYQGGTADGYILKFQNGGNYPIQAGTFIGTNNYDQSFGVQVDNDNNVYAMGNTLGGTFPVSAGVYSNPNSSQFVIKLNNALSTRIYSTVFGSGNSTTTNMSPVAFLVDSCQNVYISGWGGPLANPSGGNLIGMPVTPDAIQLTTNGGGFYFIVLSKNAQNLLYGSFLASPGAGSPEHVDGGTSRFSKDGVIYQGICGGCGGNSSFPTTPGSWSTTNNSSNCNYLAVKIAFNLGSVDASAAANPNAKGCPPLTVNFTNASTNATSYLWDFGDGSPTSSLATPTHTYTIPGVYQVKFVAMNPNACKVRDSVYLTIIVDSNRIKPYFTITKLDTCGPFRIAINNTSQLSHTPNAASFTKYVWKFGDGNTFTGPNPSPHTYASGGSYTITLLMYDSTACNNPDSFKVNVDFSGSLVKAAINLPDSICYANQLVFANSSTNATSYLWRFGDNTTSTATSPVHTYPTFGTYLVTLIAYNPNSCNKVDSIRKTITLFGYPTANFTFAPDPGTPNEPIYFTNQSSGATSYFWSFGDGGSSTDVNPVHQYTRKGENLVCLVAKNSYGCADTLCKRVYSDVRTVIDVPSAFTPNGDGHNDILFVRGAAVKTMTFKIYNRWGEVIFESNNLLVGWDGKYKGVLQEMESYAYTLEATFIDETQATKKGNITLIR